jgi:hypothetical protein
MDWMAWPPPPAPADATASNASQQQQGAHTQQQQQQQQMAGVLLEEAPTVNHWLSASSGQAQPPNAPPAGSLSAAAAAAAGTEYSILAQGYPYNPAAAAAAGVMPLHPSLLSQPHDQQQQLQLQLQSIHIGGETLFHENTPHHHHLYHHQQTFPASLSHPYNPGQILPAAAAVGMHASMLPPGPTAAAAAAGAMGMSYSLGPKAVAANLGIGGVPPQGPFDALPLALFGGAAAPAPLSAEEAKVAARVARHLRKQKVRERRQSKAMGLQGQQQEVQQERKTPGRW